MHDYFNSVFDGAAIGQYLYGTEMGGDGSIGFVNETTTFDPSLFKIVIQNKKPYWIYNNQTISINNLHMHCKNLQQLL